MSAQTQLIAPTRAGSIGHRPMGPQDRRAAANAARALARNRSDDRSEDRTRRGPPPALDGHARLMECDT